MNLEPSLSSKSISFLEIQIPPSKSLKVFNRNEFIIYILIFISIVYLNKDLTKAIFLNLMILIGRITHVGIDREVSFLKRIDQKACQILLRKEKREDHPILSKRINDCYQFLCYADWGREGCVYVEDCNTLQLKWLKDVTHFLKYYPQHSFYLKVSQKCWNIVLQHRSTEGMATLGALCQNLPPLESPLILIFEDQNIQLPFYYKPILEKDFGFFERYFRYASKNLKNRQNLPSILRNPSGFENFSTIFKHYLEYRYEKKGPFQLEFTLLEDYLNGDGWANQQFFWSILDEIKNLSDLLSIAKNPWPFSEFAKESLGNRLVKHVLEDDLQNLQPHEILSMIPQLNLKCFSFLSFRHSFSCKKEIEIVFPYLSTLNELELSLPKSVRTLAKVGFNMPGLTRLNFRLLDYYPRDSELDLALNYLVCNCKKLQSLCLNFSSRFTLTSSFQETWPLLTSLELYQCSRLDKGALETF